MNKIYSWARVLLDLPLLYLTVSSFQAQPGELFGIFWSPLKSEFTCYVRYLVHPEVIRCLTVIRPQVYALCLVTLGLKNRNSWRPTLFFHHDILMFLVFVIYAYQDLWPLTTYAQKSLDPLDILVSLKIAILFLAGIILPFVTPYLVTFSEGGDRKGFYLPIISILVIESHNLVFRSFFVDKADAQLPGQSHLLF
jgi:hypothetical protein